MAIINMFMATKEMGVLITMRNNQIIVKKPP